MGQVLTALESLAWSTVEVPLGFRRAAAGLDLVVQDEPLRFVARGFVENNECVVCLTPARVCWAEARALSLDVQRWAFDGTHVNVTPDHGRLLVEMKARGRRSVLRLFDEEASRTLVGELVQILDPRPQITFRPYVRR